jgi:exopolysaccharide production protein ExoQ
MELTKSSRGSAQQRSLSLALIVPVIWYALEASRSLTRWLTVIGYEVPSTDFVEGSPLDRAVYTILMSLGIVILITRSVRWKQVVIQNKWLIALFGYMLLSTFWSDFEEVSIKRWVRALGDGVMALVVLTDPQPLEAMGATLRRVLYVHFPLSIIFVKYVRDLGTAYDDFGVEMWTGITTHKNVLGQVVLIGNIYFLFASIRNWGSWRSVLYGSYFMMGDWLLLAPPTNKSNTSIALLFLAIVMLIAISSLKGRIEKINRYVVFSLLVLGFMCLTAWVWQAAMEESLLAASVEASGRDMTLSGRTDLWSDLMAIAADSPILGVGYGSFWIGNTHNLWDRHFWKPAQGHNGYIDVYLELGIVGLFLLGGVLVSSYKRIMRLFIDHFEMAVLRFVWLIVILIHNFTESSFLRGTVDMWFIFLLAVINIPMMRNHVDSVKTPK